MSENILKSTDAATVVTPVEMAASRLVVRVEYFETPVNLRLLQSQLSAMELLHSDPLTVRLAGCSYVVAMGFGAVVFWECPPEAREQFLAKIAGLPGMKPPVAEVRDDLPVLTGQAEDRANFKEVWLKHLTLEHMRLISQALGRSAALKHCELAVARALDNANPVAEGLKLKGALPKSARAKDLLKMVGFTLDIRQTILSKLTLFDEPPETWTSERLSRLYKVMEEYLDIRSRVTALQAKLDFLADLNETLMNLLQHLESHHLELIVTLLIVVEVVIALVEFFVHLR